MSDLVQKVEDLIHLLKEDEEFKAKLEDLLHINGFKDFLKSFSLLWWLTNKIVFAIEAIYHEYHQITEEERIELAAETLDNLIDFTGWSAPLELFDKMLFKTLISAAVAALNDKFGHGNWFTAIPDEPAEVTPTFETRLLTKLKSV